MGDCNLTFFIDRTDPAATVGRNDSIPAIRTLVPAVTTTTGLNSVPLLTRCLSKGDITSECAHIYISNVWKSIFNELNLDGSPTPKRPTSAN